MKCLFVLYTCIATILHLWSSRCLCVWCCYTRKVHLWSLYTVLLVRHVTANVFLVLRQGCPARPEAATSRPVSMRCVGGILIKCWFLKNKCCNVYFFNPYTVIPKLSCSVFSALSMSFSKQLGEKESCILVQPVLCHLWRGRPNNQNFGVNFLTAGGANASVLCCFVSAEQSWWACVSGPSAVQQTNGFMSCLWILNWE